MSVFEHFPAYIELRAIQSVFQTTEVPIICAIASHLDLHWIIYLTIFPATIFIGKIKFRQKHETNYLFQNKHRIDHYHI